MSRSDIAAEDGHGLGASSAPQAVSAPAIGKVQTVTGLVTVTRANVIGARPVVGDFVYKGDLIETGADGLIAIAFVDGTEFHLRDDARLVLDEFNYGADKSSQSALLRVLKGMFGVVAGKLAITGRLIIDTPAAQIRGTAPGAGFFGILTLTVFSFGLIRQLKAASADIAFLDDGTIDYKDLKHGVYELVTKGDHPEVIIVDDPTKTIILRARGAGSYSVQEVANTPQQMAQLQQAYQSAQEIYLRGQQDPVIQQMQHRADANPQSTGSSGSSAQFLNDQVVSAPPPISTGASGTGTPVSTSGTGGTPPPTGGSSQILPTQKATWQYDVSGNWSNPLLWSDGFAPLKWQDLEISFPVTVTIDSATGDSGPSATAVNNLTIDAGAIIDIINGGLLTVYGALVVNSGATLKVNSTGVDPTLTLDGSVTVEAGGNIEALGAGTSIFFSADAVDNSGTIAAIDSGAAVSLEQATTTNEVTGLIIANNFGTVTFDQGSVQNKGTIEGEDNGTVTFNQTSVDNFGTIAANGHGVVVFEPVTMVTNEVVSIIIAENFGVLILDAGNIITSNECGLMEETKRGELDVKDSGIDNIGTNPFADGDPNGILLSSGGTLLVDVGALTLTGGGDVVLTGGIITGSAVKAGDALVNSDNTIYGYGIISNLTLTNDFIIQAAGGTLTLDGVILDEDSTSVTPTGIDVVSALVLNDSTEIFGGGTDALTVESAGELQITAGTGLDGAIAGGATMDGVIVTDKNTSTVGIDVAAGAILTLIDNTQIIGNGGGTLTVESTGQLQITAGAAADGATAGGATLDGVIVTDDATGTDGSAGIDVSAAVLTLDGGTQINGGGTGTLTIESTSGSHRQITTATGATLDGVVVDDNNTATGANAGIYVAPGAILTLDGGAQIQGGPVAARGTLTIASTAELQVTGPATLDGVDVSDLNTTTAGIDVSGGILTLNDSTSISGGTLTVESTPGSELQITAGTGADGATTGGATLDGVQVTDSNATDGINVAAGAVLTLDNATTISGGGTMSLAGTLEVDGGANTISNITVTDFGTVADPANLIVKSGTLTLLDDNFNFPVNDASHGVIEITVDPGATLILQTTIIEDAILNNLGGTIVVSADSKIEAINSVLSGITVDPGVTLTLVNETVTGTVTNEGKIDVETFADFHDVQATNVVSPGNGIIEVGVSSNTVLLLEDGTTIIDGYLNVESGSTLEITAPLGATLDGIIVDDDGTGIGAAAGIYVASGALTLDDGTQIQGGGSGTLTIASTGELSITGTGDTLDGVIVDDENISANGIDVVSTLTLDDNTVISGGTLTVESTGELQITAGTGLDGATVGGATLDGVIVTNKGTLVVDANSTLDLQTTTINNGIFVNFGLFEATVGANTIHAAASITNNAGATLEVTGTGVTLTINSGNAVSNAGLLEATAGGTLDVQDGTIHNTGVGPSAGIVIAGSSFFEVDVGSLKLDGAGTLTLAGTITGAAANAGNELDNFDNTIVGSGTISNIDLDNDAAGTIDATGVLILNTGTVIDNAGLLEATGTGELDVKDSEINNTGSAALGISIAAAAELLVDVGSLKLDGAGTLTLAGTITGQAANAGNELDNFDNTIVGSGTISNIDLDNAAAGTIDATGVLILNTGTVIDNAGLLEATGTGELDVKESEINNTGSAALGISIAAAAELLVDVGSLKLDGAGTLTLAGTITGQAANAGNELDNFDNTIVGAGTISNIDLDNAAAGTIDATGVLILNTGTVIDNAGLLEATGTGELDVKDSEINNTGSAALGIAIAAAAELLVDVGSLKLDGAGTLTLAGTITGAAANAGNELDNFDNTIVGAGTISNILLL